MTGLIRLLSLTKSTYKRSCLILADAISTVKSHAVYQHKNIKSCPSRARTGSSKNYQKHLPFLVADAGTADKLFAKNIINNIWVFLRRKSSMMALNALYEMVMNGFCLFMASEV